MCLSRSVASGVSSASLGGTCSGEDVAEDFVIALVARVLEQSLGTPFEPDDRGPRPRPRHRIVDRELVVDSVERDAREALDEMQPVGGTHEVVPRREVGRIDDKRLPFPVSSRIPFPQSDGSRQVRAAVQMNDARFVHSLEEQDDVRRRLYDLVKAERSGAGVGSAESRHTIGQASFHMAEIFRSLWWTAAPRIGGRPSLLRFGCQRRDPAVRWIDDQRSPIVKLPLDHLERRARRRRALEMIDIGEGGEEDRIAPREIGVRVLEQTICSLAQLDDFVVGQKLPAFEPVVSQFSADVGFHGWLMLIV